MTTQGLGATLIRDEEREDALPSMTQPRIPDECIWAELGTTGLERPLEPREKVQMKPIAGVDIELQKRMLELEMMKFEERRRRDELERQKFEMECRIREEEREERRRKEEEEREERRLRDEEERRNRQEERQLRMREIQLREEELQRQIRRDKELGEKKQSLASRTKFFGEAMKNVFWKFPQDPAEIPGYFDHIENLFSMYEVDEDVRSKLLQAHLSDKAKALTVRLSRDCLDDYDALKNFLLSEFKISPIQLRERFFSLKKATDETYTLLASKLRSALIYYLRSRKVVDSFEQLVSLLCADRLKELIPKSCLDFILAQEKDNWLELDELAHSVDVYMSSHEVDGTPMRSYGNPSKRDNHNQRGRIPESSHVVRPEMNSVTKSDSKQVTYTKANKEEMLKKGLCFICSERGHMAKECKRKSLFELGGKKTAHTNACALGFPSETPQESSSTLEPEHSGRLRQTYESIKCDGENARLVEESINFEPHKSYIDADEFHVRAYVDVNIEGLPEQKALIDGGSEICCISAALVESLNLPVCKQVSLSGLQGKSNFVNVVRLHVKPACKGNDNESFVNIAPSIRVWFAVVPDLNESVILTPNVVTLLQEVAKYNVLSVKATEVTSSNIDASVEVDGQANVDLLATIDDTSDDNLTSKLSATSKPIENVKDQFSEKKNTPTEFFDIEQPQRDHDERTADSQTLQLEQKNCPSLRIFWDLAQQNKSNFFINDGLLYHRETIMGYKVKQLCLPECRIPIVLRMGHDAPFAGHMAFKSTRYRVKLHFWFPKMDDRIRSYCSTCSVCQLRAPVKVSDRVPITPIPRDEELPFTHLVMDCIGPIIPQGDSSLPKPEYNYALVVVDKFSRWPMAYPLRSFSAKATCDALLQIFMTFSIPKIISSDCGTNFVSQLTQEMLKRLGCPGGSAPDAGPRAALPPPDRPAPTARRCPPGPARS